VGIGSFDPRRHVREATADDVFFCGDSAGHCLPLTAEGIRPAFYFGVVLGRELQAVIEGQRTRADAIDCLPSTTARSSRPQEMPK